MAGGSGPSVEAAGGIVWRGGAETSLEVLVVHRPLYDDWTFPKGKQDADDPDAEHTALREVLEETGYRCVSGHEIAGTEYVDHKGRAKRVRYWEMRVVDGRFTVNDEVDEARWLDAHAAARLLSFDRDRDVLTIFVRWRAAQA